VLTSRGQRGGGTQGDREFNKRAIQKEKREGKKRQREKGNIGGARLYKRDTRRNERKKEFCLWFGKKAHKKGHPRKKGTKGASDRKTTRRSKKDAFITERLAKCHHSAETPRTWEFR